MREKIRSFLSNGTTRRALLSAGAYIASAYFGVLLPGGFEALHEAFQAAVAASPFGDPIPMITTLYEGAQYHAAGAIHAVGDWFQSVGVELSQRAREQIEQARTFLGPAADKAKTLFVETWQPVSAGAIMLRDQIRNAIPSSDSIPTLVKDAFNLLRNAVEAYGIYEAGKKLYEGIFSRAKKDLKEQVKTAPEETPAVTERSVNLNLNTAIGGGVVADAALRDREIRFEHKQDPTAGLSAMSSDQIIWVSDKLKKRVSSELNNLIADVSDTPYQVNLRAPDPARLEDAVDPVADLSHRDRFPTINWGQSDLSEDRLRRMRCGSRITGLDHEDLKDIRIVLAEDGTLQAERATKHAPSPDLLM